MGIGKRALRSTLFVTVNTYASLGIATFSTIIMARLLLPEHFGVVALAGFFQSLFGRVKEFGLDHALIHRQDDLEEAFKAHFTLQVGFSLINLLLSIISIPFLTHFYSLTMVEVLLVLSLFTVLQSASATPRIFLEKELRFGRTTVVDIASLALSSLLGILAALMGLGLWSLVILNSSGILFTFLGLFFISGWKFELSFDKKMISWFLKFGVFLWLGGVTTFIIFQYNDFIIGTYVSAVALGFYTKAFQFAQLPTSLVTGIVSRVALPTYSKLQKDTEKLSIMFNLVLRNIFRVSGPFSLMLFLVAEEFIRIFLGDKWLPMVPLLKMLIVYLLLRPVFDDTGAFLTAIGKPQSLSKYLSIQALLILVLTPLLVYFGQSNGAVISLNIVMGVGVVFAYYYANKYVKIHYKEVFLPTLIALFLTIVFYYLIDHIFSLGGLNLYIRFVVKSIIIGSVYLGLIFLLEGKQIIEDLKLLTGGLDPRNADN